MYDERDKHLRLVVVKQASADVLKYIARFSLEIVEIFIRVLRAPLLRQIEQLCGSFSTSSTERPVVVKPLTDSNSACTGVTVPYIKNGTAARRIP